MSLRRRFTLSSQRQRQASWLMEVALVGLLFIGIERGETGIIVNTAVALLIVQLPPVLERDYGLPMSPAITLWITAAVFLHALGTVGIPGSGATFYTTVGWWDHLTHVLSSSVVAAVGYATVRAIDSHDDAVSLPARFTFVFVLLFTMAFGVAWEVLEFGLAEAAASLGSGAVLTQYGLEDTMLDLLFDLIGGVIVALWGTVYLTDVVGVLSERLAARSETRGP